MRASSISFVAMSLSLAVPAGAAFAQSPLAAISPGMQVVDTAGGVVGTVTAVHGDIITVKTDRLEANLSTASFTPHEGKLLFGMTQAELNSATEKALAEAAASLQPGATVKGSGGAVVGTLEAIDDEFATIKLASGKSVRLPRNGIAGSADGAVIGLTVAQLEAQLTATE